MNLRPYRSHKIRACDPCRKHKLRCIVDKPGQACQRCRSRGDSCLHVSSNHLRASQPVVRPLASLPQFISPLEADPEGRFQSRQAQQSSQPIPPSASDTDQVLYVTSSGEASVATSSSLEETKSRRPIHVLGTSGAFDSQFLEQHLVPDPKSHAGQELISIYSSDKRKPVGFASLLQIQENVIVDPARSNINRRKVIEQILGPNAVSLLELYLRKSHAAFPIIDKATLLVSSSDGKPSSVTLFDGLSDALVCGIYSNALIYWKSSKTLSSFPCPDTHFLHSLTSGVLQDDFANPRLSTVAACLIHLNQRPVMSVIANSMDVGRVVALAHSLGLNKDPAPWKIPQHEKGLRVRLWWGVLIHDTWSACARGVPAHIVSTQYDVPVLTVDKIIKTSSDTAQEIAAARGFVLLCELTLILRELMTVSYNLVSEMHNNIVRVLRQHEASLDLWEDSFLMWKTDNNMDNSSHIGESNLNLGFLTTKMLLRRIALHNSSTIEPQPLETRQYNQMSCRKATHDIVEFITSLKKHDFEDFWLPYAASHLTVCVTLLLRCALETDDHSIARLCMEDVRKFQDALRTARNEYNWELGETSIAHCETLVSRIKTVSIGSGETDDEITSRHDVRIGNGQVEVNVSNPDFWALSNPMDDLSWNDMISQIEFNDFFQNFMGEGLDAYIE